MYGKEIKNARIIFGASQPEVSEGTGIPQSTVSWIELNKGIPNIQQCIALADFYGISLDELVGRDVTSSSTLTKKEIAAGARNTKTEHITPIEDDMLYAFREVGKKYGEKAQQALIDVAETMAEIK